MRNRKDELKSTMLEHIREGGAWFTTRKDKYIKIGFSGTDNCYFARECFLKDGSTEGGAYSFGTDWFDINFHGRYIDIYVDPETFRSWPVRYDAERGTCFEDADEGAGQAGRILDFCRQADTEALVGIKSAYQIDSANFDAVTELSGQND